MEKLFVIGHPVAHSKSPVMYNALYGSLGLPWSYDFVDFTEESRAADFITQRDYLSINITMPYKNTAFAACDVTAASAKLTGGVNMIVNRNGSLIGVNTDGVGCVADARRGGADFKDARVVVCGTGPTSLAIVHAAAMAGAAEVSLLGRDKQRSSKVLQKFFDTYKSLAYAAVDLPVPEGRSFRESFDETDFKFGSYDVSAAAIRNADIIIDATPLGMDVEDPAPFDTSVLQAGQFVYDVVYVHGTTALLAAAEQAGCVTMNGQGMLVAQAVENACLLLDVCEIADYPARDDMFSMMAAAAGFPC